MDITNKNHLIRKKSKRELEKAKMMNPQHVRSIADSMNGRQRMQGYLDRAEERSRSVSHIRSSSYDL